MTTDMQQTAEHKGKFVLYDIKTSGLTKGYDMQSSD